MNASDNGGPPGAIAIIVDWTVGVCLTGALVLGRTDVGGHSARLGCGSESPVARANWCLVGGQ